MFKFNCSLGNRYFWRCMLEHTKRQVFEWKFLQHALCRYVYNRSLFDIFTSVLTSFWRLRSKSLVSSCNCVRLKNSWLDCLFVVGVFLSTPGCFFAPFSTLFTSEQPEKRQNGFCLYIVSNKVTLWAASYSAYVVYTKTIIHLSVGESGVYFPHC